MSIAENKYLSLTTYKSDGTPKPCPIWIVEDTDGSPVFTTFLASWKVKRLRNNPSVTLQPCDSRGTVIPGSEVIEAKATVMADSDFARVRSLIKAKYGIGFYLIQVLTAVRALLGKGGKSDCAVHFDLD